GADVADLEPGQRATFTVDAWPNDTFTAELVALAAAGLTTQNVVGYEAVFTVGPHSRPLLPGMTANLTVTTSERAGALIVPNRAIGTVGGEARVTLWRQGRPIEVPVEIGLSNDSQ